MTLHAEESPTATIHKGTTTFKTYNMEKRIHGGGVLKAHVIELYEAGWHLPHIVSFVHERVGVVRNILLEHGVDVDKIER